MLWTSLTPPTWIAYARRIARSALTMPSLTVVGAPPWGGPSGLPLSRVAFLMPVFEVGRAGHPEAPVSPCYPHQGYMRREAAGVSRRSREG